MSLCRKITPIFYNYCIDHRVLSRVNRIKDLGVSYDDHMNFAVHIDSIVNKANATLGFIKRWAKEFQDPFITRTLYCTFVRPILEYASCVWCPYVSVHINRVEMVQRRFVRFALRGLPWDNPIILPPYHDRLQLIKLDSLQHRRHISKTVFAFECLQGFIDSPKLISSFAILVPARSLRHVDFLRIDRHKTNYGSHEPITSMSRYFNEFFDHIDFNLSKQNVKSRLIGNFST